MLVRAVAASQPPPPPLGSTIAARLRALDPQAACDNNVSSLETVHNSSEIFSQVSPLFPQPEAGNCIRRRRR